MRVTVCEWPDTVRSIARAWNGLVEHTRAQSSELVVLPEMPFSPWLPESRRFDASRWVASERSHQEWETRLGEANAAAIVATRPFTFGDERVSSAFIWEPSSGVRSVHASSRTRNQEGAWEQVWYAPTPPEFTPAHVGGVLIGVLIGIELRNLEEARRYGESGVQLLITPRTSAAAEHDPWMRAAMDAAAVSGAFSLSSNRGGRSFGGRGWIVSADGQTLALTTPDEPFMTREIDVHRASLAVPARERDAIAP